jgi:hypothetical protein
MASNLSHVEIAARRNRLPPGWPKNATGLQTKNGDWELRAFAAAAIGPWQKPRSPPGTAAYWGTAATKGTSAVVRSPDGVHAPRHGRRRRPTKLERTSETVEPDRNAMALRSPMWSTGSLRIVPIRARPLPETLHHRHGRKPRRARRQDLDRAAILYLLPRARPQPSPKSYEATGPSKITFTGASTLPSTRINHACVSATAPRIWPSYATSLSIWFAKSQTNDPSSDAASAPPGTQNICLKYWGRRNLTSTRCPGVRPRCGLLAGRGGLLCFGLAAIQQWRRIIIHASR